LTEPLKIIIAPHEIHLEEIKALQEQLHKKSVRFSQAEESTVAQYSVLIIDNIGMLSSLYQYGEFAYIGGAFGKGLHNILEAATFGMPVFFGTNYHKFQEAKDLLSLKAAISVANTQEFSRQFVQLYNNEPERLEKATLASSYVQQHTGATQLILDYCQKLLPLKRPGITGFKSL
jgi:3-deoxy-D-manno-octulosonic-acid transferase